MYLITAYEDAERYILAGKRTRTAKIYNGMMKTYFYQFMGPKPPRRKTGIRLKRNVFYGALLVLLLGFLVRETV